MKGPFDRTKVVLRRLPPTISQSILMEQVDSRFAGRYHWVSFLPGKISHKHQCFSRAYINFTRQEDVVEFAEFFNGHIFVNEKGSQFKSIVEYAPSQRVPKQWFKKDGREGTILKDPEYLEFLELLAKPVENLPSAEIQLERKEAEGAAGVAMDAPIVTPLMDYVRQKRAAKGGSRRPLLNGRLTRRSNGASSGSANSASSKRSSERKKTSTTMYVLRDTVKNTGSKEKSTFILVSKRDNEQLSDKFDTSVAASGSGCVEEESGVSGTTDLGKKKILLLKGKEKEISLLSGGLSQQQNAPCPVKNLLGSTAVKQNQQREASGRFIRSILLSKDARQSHSPVILSEQQIQSSNQEKDKRPPKPPNVQLLVKDANGISEDKVVGKDLRGFCSDKQGRTRNKDRPDRGVWTPLRRSDGSRASDESSSSSVSQPAKSLLDAAQGVYGEMKIEIPNARGGEYKSVGSGRGGRSTVDNGSHKHSGRRGPAKDGDGSAILSDGKSSKRGGSSSFGSHEKQMWVQKSSGS